jgi:hypothetical protein
VSTAARVRDLAVRFLEPLPPERRSAVLRTRADPEATRWTYLPQRRPGLSWAEMDRRSRKAVHALLATVLSERCFAQAVGVMAHEDVLDLREGGEQDRHHTDYWTAFYGAPDGPWFRWRTEGHHFSVTVTVRGDRCVPSPLFLGLNPARMPAPGGRSISALCWEEQLARDLVAALAPGQRARAVLPAAAPYDLLSEHRATVRLPLAEPGVAAADLAGPAAGLLADLVELYLGRYAPAVRAELLGTGGPGPLSFAWAGGTGVGDGHYYRVQGGGVLIEYCNTQNSANHIHSVLRLVDREAEVAA